MCVSVCVYVYVCVSVCERERDREVRGGSLSLVVDVPSVPVFGERCCKHGLCVNCC